MLNFGFSLKFYTSKVPKSRRKDKKNICGTDIILRVKIFQIFILCLYKNEKYVFGRIFYEVGFN